MEINDEANNAMNITSLKIPAGNGQLAIYKRGPGIEVGSTEKELQLSGQSGKFSDMYGGH